MPSTFFDRELECLVGLWDFYAERVDRLVIDANSPMFTEMDYGKGPLARDCLRRDLWRNWHEFKKVELVVQEHMERIHAKLEGRFKNALQQLPLTPRSGGVTVEDTPSCEALDPTEACKPIVIEYPPETTSSTLDGGCAGNCSFGCKK